MFGALFYVEVSYWTGNKELATPCWLKKTQQQFACAHGASAGATSCEVKDTHIVIALEEAADVVFQDVRGRAGGSGNFRDI